MLYKNILSNNQGIKEVRCANEVIWRKKVEQLLRVKFPSANSTNMWLNCLEVRKKYVYALVRTSSERSSIVKMKIDGEKLSLIGQLSINSVSSVLVVDPRNEDLVYVVAPRSESDIYLNLLCVDTVNWRTKPMSDTSVKNCYMYGYGEDGIVLYNSFELFFFKYNSASSYGYVKTTFDNATMSVTKLSIPSDIQGFSSFSKSYEFDDIFYIANKRTNESGGRQIVGATGLSTYVDGTRYDGSPIFKTRTFINNIFELPFSGNDRIYNIFSQKVVINIDAYVYLVFVSRDGCVYILDEDKLNLFKNSSTSDYTKKQSYAYKLLDYGNEVVECAYDDESKMLTIKTRESDYEQTKKEFLKSYCIDYSTKPSNKNLSPIWTKEFTSESLSSVFYGNKTSLIHSRESKNDSEIIFGYETLVRPTPPPVIPDNGSTLKPKYQWDIKDTTTYVKADRVENGVTYYKIRDEFVDKSKANFHICVYYDYYKGDSIKYITFYKEIAGIQIKIPNMQEGDGLRKNNTDFLGYKNLSAGQPPCSYDLNGAQSCIFYYFEVEKEKINEGLNNEVDNFVKSIK